MTSRGGMGSPPPPVSPKDPSLQTNPVPFIQDLPSYSIGPGAASDAASYFHTIQELIELHKPLQEEVFDHIEQIKWDQATLCCAEKAEDFDRPDEEELALVESIRDRTWGFYVFVTDYSTEAQAALPIALEKMLQCIRITLQRTLTNNAHLAIVEEAWERCRFEIVEDETSLSGASIDRIRDQFTALLRARRPGFGDRNIGHPLGARNLSCIVLDTEAIQTIAGLDVLDKYTKEQEQAYRTLDVRVIKAVDTEWKRPERSDSDYRGWYATSPVDLMYLYYQIGHRGQSWELEDMYEADRRFP